MLIFSYHSFFIHVYFSYIYFEFSFPINTNYLCIIHKNNDDKFLILPICVFIHVHGRKKKKNLLASCNFI